MKIIRFIEVEGRCLQTIYRKYRHKKCGKPCKWRLPHQIKRARDVAERPVDVRFATTEAERRPRMFESGRARIKKGYPFLDILFLILESARRDSNPRPQPWQGCTPPTEPLAHNQIGVTGFEPATSWSQTRRSSQAEPHPVFYCSTYLQNHTLNNYPSNNLSKRGSIHRLSAYFMSLASPMPEACQVPASRCKHLPSVPFHSSAAP